jgi:hypothetical protein
MGSCRFAIWINQIVNLAFIAAISEPPDMLSGSKSL